MRAKIRSEFISELDDALDDLNEEVEKVATVVDDWKFQQ